MTKLMVGKFPVIITNPDKILFPKDKITKAQIIEYYYNIAPIMVNYTKDHPLSMHRYPQGIQSEGFFHKDAPDFFPKWIKTIKIKKRSSEGSVKYVVANNEATLVYLANYGCLTPHLWLSKIDKLDYPDRLIFDLDPYDEKSFPLLKETAKELKQILEDKNLIPYVMTTGSRGLHVTVPLKRTKNFDTVREFAREIGEILVQNNQKKLTMEIRKEKRSKKVFIDTLRNSFSATAVSPYAVRAKNGAPVATPLNWEELEEKNLNAQKYNINNIFKRLEKIGDPWKDFNKLAKTIKFK